MWALRLTANWTTHQGSGTVSVIVRRLTTRKHVDGMAATVAQTHAQQKTIRSCSCAQSTQTVTARILPLRTTSTSARAPLNIWTGWVTGTVMTTGPMPISKTASTQLRAVGTVVTAAWPLAPTVHTTSAEHLSSFAAILTPFCPQPQQQQHLHLHPTAQVSLRRRTQEQDLRTHLHRAAPPGQSLQSHARLMPQLPSAHHASTRQHPNETVPIPHHRDPTSRRWREQRRWTQLFKHRRQGTSTPLHVYSHPAVVLVVAPHHHPATPQVRSPPLHRAGSCQRQSRDRPVKHLHLDVSPPLQRSVR